MYINWYLLSHIVTRVSDMNCKEHCCSICTEYQTLISDLIGDSRQSYVLGPKAVRGLCFFAKNYGVLCLKADIEIYVWGGD